MTSTLVELQNVKEENLETNSAIKVLLKHKETDNHDARTELSKEVESTIFPLLKKLKKISAARAESLGLIEVLETNLQHLLQYYGRKSDLRGVYQRLSPVERQVASMVRQGFSTKLIATTLKSSPETVNNHRKHIRKKLGLDNKATNLYGFLNSLDE